MRRVVQTTEGTDLPPVQPTTPAVADSATWNRLQSFSDPRLFVRHSAYKGVLAPAPITPFMDSMWQAVPGLADPKGISFESLNFNTRGHYLVQRGNEVVLAKDDGSAAFKTNATFFKVPGLADQNWSSFRAASAPDLYLRRANDALRMGAIATPSDAQDATFRLTFEGEGARAARGKIARSR